MRRSIRAAFSSSAKCCSANSLLDVGDDLGVVDGVFDAVAVRGMFAAQADFEIELDGLRDLLFPLVDADAGLDAQFADEYGVHGMRAEWAAV